MRLLAIVLSLGALLCATAAPAAIFLYEDFEDPWTGDVDGWTTFGYINGDPGSLWHRETYRSVSGDYSMAYNTGFPNYNYDVGTSEGTVATPWLDLSSAGEVYLEFKGWLETQLAPNQFDVAFVVHKADGGSWAPVPVDFQIFPQARWLHYIVDLSPALAYLPVDARIGFYFNSVNSEMNDFEGWYIDDVAVHDGNAAPTPEPSTWLLLSTGLLGLGAAIAYATRVLFVYPHAVSDESGISSCRSVIQSRSAALHHLFTATRPVPGVRKAKYWNVLFEYP